MLFKVMALTLLLNCGPASLIPLDLPPPITRDRSVYPAEDMIRIALRNINVSITLRIRLIQRPQ